MRPESKRNRTDQFTPKYRHFHPQDTLFLRNPFGHEIKFRVADEFNTPYTYHIKPNQITELPGGSVATLGLKEIVDKMISDEGTDVLRIWDPIVRKRKEDLVIVRVREAPQAANGSSAGGDIELPGVTEEEIDGRDDSQVTATEEEFPGAKRQQEEQAAAAPPPPVPSSRSNKASAPIRGGNGRATDPALAGIAASSATGKDQIVESD